MTLLKNLGIKYKILLGYAVVITVFASLVGYIFSSTRAITDEAREIELYNYPRIELATLMMRSQMILESLEATLQVVGLDEIRTITPINKNLQIQIAKFETSLSEYEQLSKGNITAESDAISLRNDWEAYKAGMLPGKNCAHKNGLCRTALLKVREHTEDIHNEILGELSSELGHISELASSMFNVYCLLLLGAIVIGGITSLYVAASLSGPLRELITLQNAFKSGAQTQPPRDIRADEIGDLQSSFYDMAKQLTSAQAVALRAEKMSAVGQLAAGVAHEINNPLGIILGFAQSVAKRIKNEDDPLSLPLKTIEREAVRCKDLVQNLLVFSRSSKGNQLEELDLNAAVESALSLILTRTKTHNVELVRELGAGLPQIHANKTQLQQILINLANNAIDAMPKGGTLTISTALSAKQPGHVEIRVKDTGTGIPNDLQKKIFEPFFTTKEVGKGTGLGLSLVYEIVMKHGGTIELESEEGKGTEFTVSLPVHSATAPAAGASL